MHRALLPNSTNALVLLVCLEAALDSAGGIDHAAALLERVVQRDPNGAKGLAMLAHVRRLLGEDPRTGHSLIDQAMRLSPRYPHSAFFCQGPHLLMDGGRLRLRPMYCCLIPSPDGPDSRRAFPDAECF